jgi:hypothetical protein
MKPRVIELLLHGPGDVLAARDPASGSSWPSWGALSAGSAGAFNNV